MRTAAFERAALVGLALGVGAALAACEPRAYSADPKTSGDDPSVNPMTSAPVQGVPFCSGGDRARACLLGKNCRVTEQGCQVCQCLAVQ